MYTISKDFTFSAAHRLSGLSPDHPCARDHGHNYVVRLELAAASLDATGFVEDYRALDAFKQWVDARLDHRHLNDIFAGQPSAEHIARVLYDQWRPRLPALVAVSVSETTKTWATYRPSA